MAYLTVEELYSHLYRESIETIARGDTAILEAAIDAAIQEARGYLTRFNSEKIFSALGPARHGLLLLFVKDMAVWHFINLGNAAVDMDIREKRYDRAVDWLKAVQKGNVSPGLAEKDPEPGISSRNNPIGDIAYGSNPKRCQHF